MAGEARFCAAGLAFEWTPLDFAGLFFVRTGLELGSAASSRTSYLIILAIAKPHP